MASWIPGLTPGNSRDSSLTTPAHSCHHSFHPLSTLSPTSCTSHIGYHWMRLDHTYPALLVTRISAGPLSCLPFIFLSPCSTSATPTLPDTFPRLPNPLSLVLPCLVPLPPNEVDALKGIASLLLRPSLSHSHLHPCLHHQHLDILAPGATPLVLISCLALPCRWTSFFAANVLVPIQIAPVLPV
jgi:hypothetical protein